MCRRAGKWNSSMIGNLENGIKMGFAGVISVGHGTAPQRLLPTRWSSMVE
jgi:hypothetical protein